MKTLNLVDLEKSDIKYKISKFPDGQQNIVIIDELYEEGITIKSRLNNFMDLELIICAKKALQCSGYFGNIHLYTPYFLGSRSDRHFGGCTNNYLKDVICPIINSLNFESVTVLDPHSDVLEACLNNFKKISNLELVKFAFNSIYNIVSGETAYLKQDNCILVSPDAGASKKVYKLAEQIGYKGDIITCSKSRDEQGQLSKVHVPISYTGSITSTKKDYIIIDDICDGGATFINIAKQIKNASSDFKIYLIVTHGIFSKGFIELYQYFDGIYCTNSYKDKSGYEFTTEKFIQIDKLVKQLNVF